MTVFLLGAVTLLLIASFGANVILLGIIAAAFRSFRVQDQAIRKTHALWSESIQRRMYDAWKQAREREAQPASGLFSVGPRGGNA